MKKFELTAETKTVFGRMLHRIKATASFGDVAIGDLGGWIEKESNLSDNGNAWVYGNAKVYGDARVCGDARVYNTNGILCIGPIGSRGNTTTFFNCADGKICVSCGCFLGDLGEFAEAVKKTHGDSNHGKVYALAISMAQEHIGVTKND